MDRKNFKEYLTRQIMILDGAMGTQLQKKGMPNGACPEQWVIEHPETVIEIQNEYRQAGSDALYTCTFSGNRVKLAEYGLGDQVIAMNRRLAEISREVAGTDGFVAGDISSTGRFVRPFGDLPFEDAVNIYKEQVEGLLEGGVDFFVIETMFDIQEVRAALLAVKESCDLPVCVSLTFDKEGLTLTGTDPVTGLITLQYLGADAVGCNCSTGPQDMLSVITVMKPYSTVPLLAKPNAGLPKIIDGKTVFDLEPASFGKLIKPLIEQGANLIGGCCGTSPEYIREIKKAVTLGIKPPRWREEHQSAVTSSRKTVFPGFGRPAMIVGERINPTGKKKLQEELRSGELAEVRRLALEQLENGAEILDVNVGLSGIDEANTMVKVVENLITFVDAPLCLDSSTPEVLEAALRIYPGRALINSISGETQKLQRLLPIAAKYGAMFILLPLTEAGIPEIAGQRYPIIEQVFNNAAQYGFQKNDIIIDGLVMTVSANQNAALETLKLIEWSRYDFGCGSIVGLSNVSFGLPERNWLNAAFLAMAIGKGLTMAIANPANELLLNIKMAGDVLTGNDKHSEKYIAFFKKSNQTLPSLESKKTDLPIVEQIYEAVVRGEGEGIRSLIESALNEGIGPNELVERHLIPAITHVGALFEEKKYFLPQLIQSGETMKFAFHLLEPLLQQSETKSSQEKVKIVLATVKGDIHDIGKNIVGLMLKNYGFEVIDLGKDVSAEDIISKTKSAGAQIIGLSALMTTTMIEMKSVIDLAKQAGLNCKIMIGGAVVNEQYAREIGADGYAGDAHQAVKLAQYFMNGSLRSESRI